ncbi:SDR family NAD(P)-dependent oxidoreductase [Streptomyces sp. L7]
MAGVNDVNAQLRLDGRTVWVTGAGKGLGRAIAVALSQAGATVAATACTAADLDSLEAELAAHGGKVLVLRPARSPTPPSYGPSSSASPTAPAASTRSSTAPVRVPTSPAAERVTDEDWQQVLDVNLQGTFCCCREAGKVMLEQRSGSIVNVSSVHARTGFERIAAYAASKGGVEALTKALAARVGRPRGAGSTPSRPRYFHTDLSSGLLASRWGERIVDLSTHGVGPRRRGGGARRCRRLPRLRRLALRHRHHAHGGRGLDRAVALAPGVWPSCDGFGAIMKSSCLSSEGGTVRDRETLFA